MVKEQLDLTPEILRIENLLRGKYQTTNQYGEIVWEEPKDNSNQCLTEDGVQFILNFVSWYLNKNTLLSAYDAETILEKMEDLSISLTENLVKKEKIYLELKTGTEVSEEDTAEIKKKVIGAMDLQKEIEKISENEKKDRLKGFENLIRVVQDSIHSAYLRAFGGGERRSIRSTMSTVENVTQAQPVKKSANPLSWFTK